MKLNEIDNEKKVDKIGITNKNKNTDFSNKITDSLTSSDTTFRKNNNNNELFLSSLHDEPKDINETRKQAINPFVIPHMNNNQHTQ